MIPTAYYFPVNFTPKKCRTKLNSLKKNCRSPKRVSGPVSKSQKRPFWRCRIEFFFFFREKKVNHGLLWCEIYRTLLLQTFHSFPERGLGFHCEVQQENNLLSVVSRH